MPITLIMRPTGADRLALYGPAGNNQPRLFATSAPHQPQAIPPQKQPKQKAEEEKPSDD
jgi:hypothetical protein